jgi:hypothetical protein
MKTILCASFCLLIGIFFGCSKPASKSGPASEEMRKQELKAALEKYLAARGTINVAAMDIEILQATFADNTAEAQVEFRTKQGQGAMQMTYAFERQNGTWVVKSSSGGMGHPDASMQAPSAMPGQMPPGHPPVRPPEQSPPPPQP